MRRAMVRYGRDRHVTAAKESKGLDRMVGASFGKSRYGSRGTFWIGMEGRVEECCVTAAEARRGAPSYVMDWNCMAWIGSARQPCCVVECRGEFWFGGLGKLRLGQDRLGSRGAFWKGEVWIVVEGRGPSGIGVSRQPRRVSVRSDMLWNVRSWTG